MKKDLGDHIGKKKNWILWEFGEALILGIRWFFGRKKEKTKANKLMDGITDPDPGTTPDPPQ
jgi:hypothetical protein